MMRKLTSENKRIHSGQNLSGKQESKKKSPFSPLKIVERHEEFGFETTSEAHFSAREETSCFHTSVDEDNSEHNSAPDKEENSQDTMSDRETTEFQDF